MKNRVLLLCMVLILAVSGILLAGGKQEAKEKAPAAKTEAPAVEEETGGVMVEKWEIPFLNVLTGPIASIGEYLQWGAERAAEEINAAGGIAGKPVEIIRIDTGMSPEKGSVEMAKVVEKDYLAVLGPVPEPVIMAACPISVEAEMLAFTATTSFEYAVQFFPWSVSWFAKTEEKLPPIVYVWAKKHPDMKKVVQFVENYGVWRGMADAHKIGLEKAGVQILPDVDVPLDAVTFGPLIVKALAQKPDGIIFACNAEKVAKIIIELKNRGWGDMSKLLVFSSADDAALYTTGGSNINGINIYNYVDPNLNTKRWQDFRQAFKDDHEGIEPFSLSPNYYDAVYMIKEAIEAEGLTGDPKKLKAERKALADYARNVQDFEGLFFSWTNKDGVPTDKPVYLFEIQDGKKIFIETVKGAVY
jgi:branched-chain amino acid transport system substrate-binding protein